MDESSQLAITEFEGFLSGHKAPALVGQALAEVMKSDVKTVARIVVGWAIRNPGANFVESLVQARNKVFDIFFFRVVRFGGVHKFFPAFESAVLALCPPHHREPVERYFRDTPWQSLRPIGDLRSQPIFALEKRTEAPVQEEGFNEDIYKNVTHNLLSIENRFAFADDKTKAILVEHAAKVGTLFTDFAGLVKEKQAKKEIYVANEADKGAAYENRKRFDFEEYLLQSLDLAIAFFNDDYLLQSVQMVELVIALARSKEFNIDNSSRFQSKFNLFGTRKIEEYTQTKTNRFLVRNILGYFHGWYPGTLLEALQTEENRRTRRVYLNVLECYGGSIYPMLLSYLTNATPQTPWYFIRNLVYLLGRVTSPDPGERAQAAELTGRHLTPESMRQVNAQCTSTLSFLGNETAASVLTAKLAIFKKYEDQPSVDTTNRIAQALVGFDAPKAVEAALDHALKNWSAEYTERFSQLVLPPSVQAVLIEKIRSQVKKMKLSFSLLGNVDGATHLLTALAFTPTPQVLDFCREITRTLPANNPLHQRANGMLSQLTAIQPPASSDRMVNRLATAKNIPELVCHIHESGLGGRLTVRTTEGIEGTIDFDRGNVLRAAVPAFLLDNENAFYWTFLLEATDVAQISLQPVGTGALGLPLDTDRLIQEGLIQRGEVQQIIGVAMAPDSHFSQRTVSPLQYQFKGIDDPARYKLVWDSLVTSPDITELQQLTRLGKYDLYRILFYLVKQNMVAVDADRMPPEKVGLGEGFAMIEAYLQRIAKRPVLFNAYKAAAEVCDEVRSTNSDQTVGFALDVLKKYLLNAYNTRRVLVTENLNTCAQALGLLGQYVKTKFPSDRQALLDYIDFSFQEKDMAVVAAPIEEAAPNVLQQIENIELGNDAFDAEMLFDETSVDDMFTALDTALTVSGVDLPDAGQDGGLTPAEEAMLMELYDNIAMAYVKPLKDFIREIRLNLKIRRRTSLEWIEMVEPAIGLLSSSAEKMGYRKICLLLSELQESFDSQKAVPDQTYFLDDALQGILFYYEQLSKQLPKTFALELSEADLNSKKEVLIVKFILKQLPDLTEKHLNRIILAGLSTFDRFMESSPDEIAAVTGLTKKQGEDVFMKFYQYRHIYYRHDDEAYREKFFQMFGIKLNILREIHAEVEHIQASQKMDTEDAKVRFNGLKQDRQRVLWAIFILLCIKEEYDLIETIQQSVFDIRLQRLEEYRERLAAAL